MENLQAYYTEFQYYGLLRELANEWAMNHAEHCSSTVPCLKGSRCMWRLPKTLEGLSIELLNQLMVDCGRTYNLR